MSKKTLVMLCFLGDPMLPPVSCPNTGGYNVDTKEMLEYLAKTEWNCLVITNTSSYLSDTQERYSERIYIRRVLVDDAHVNDQSFMSSEFPRILGEVKRIIGELDTLPSLIHSYYWFSGYLAYMLKRELGIPFVHSLVSLSMDKINTGTKPRSNIQTNWERVFLLEASVLLAITDHESRILIKNYNVNPDKVVVVGRGVDQAFRNPAHDERGYPPQLLRPFNSGIDEADSALPKSTLWWNGGAFLFMGRLREIKGIDIIIYAWYELYKFYQAETPPLWIVGGDPDAIEAMRKTVFLSVPEIEEAEAQYKLCWWGYMNPAGISALLLKTMVLVTHSKFEAGGRIIIEAMSARKPVISTPTGFGADYISNWQNGFLVDYGNVQELAIRMEHFIRQPLLGNVLGNTAIQTFKRIEEQWNCYKKHMQIYNIIINSECTDSSISQIKASQTSEKHADFFEKGILTAYPYHTPEKTTVAAKLSKLAGSFGPVLGVESREQGKHANFWDVSLENDKFKAKQFYSLLNPVSIWNSNCGSEVIPASTRIQRVLICSGAPNITPVVWNDTANHIILMPDYPLLVGAASPHAMLQLAQAINCYETEPEKENEHLTCLDSGIKDLCTLAGLWNEIKTEHTKCFSQPWKELWHNWDRKLLPFIDQTVSSPERICLSYGKNYAKHVCLSPDGNYCLYPSDKTFYCEIGYDASSIIVNHYLLGISADLREFARNFDLAGQMYGFSVMQFKSWCLYHVIKEALKAVKTLTYDNYEKIDRLLVYLAG